jgi:hypothetical protein
MIGGEPIEFSIQDKLPLRDVPVLLHSLKTARKAAHELVHEKKTHPQTHQFDQDILGYIHEKLKWKLEDHSPSMPTNFGVLNGKGGYSSGGGFHHVDAYIYTEKPQVTTYIISVVNCDWIARIHQMPAKFTDYSCYLDAEETDNQVMGCEIFTEYELEQLEKKYGK